MQVIARRSVLQMGLAAGGAALLPRWATGQEPVPPLVQKDRDFAAKTPIRTTKLADNVFALQGAGGNMAVQTGPEGNILIDASFATAVPFILEAIKKLSGSAPHTLINTHWHFDHTDGNEGIHQAGYTICAHQRTRERLSTPQVVKLYGLSLPATPVGGRPVITFSQGMHLWHNGDQIDMAHFEPAHTDTDIYIHFRKANVLHVGDIWFNGMYPFIDESSGGNIHGMIEAGEVALGLAGPDTKIIPGHGALGSRAQLQEFHDMLRTVRDKVGALKAAGDSEKDAIAKKPTAALDAKWSNFITGDAFTGIVYRTL